jgi:hypothetical protein
VTCRGTLIDPPKKRRRPGPGKVAPSRSRPPKRRSRLPAG